MAQAMDNVAETTSAELLIQANQKQHQMNQDCMVCTAEKEEESKKQKETKCKLMVGTVNTLTVCCL